ncbi:hypothetical protein LNV07_22905 [Paucibacter oligotrophus]|uniref:Uncharacterized protein n=1 Tax=Roseateles oligotrophus TaxID=1769250 RepID=A0ABT2YLS1_9BURK|nr:hypothetical protein [Roseateles oligotrophus]
MQAHQFLSTEESLAFAESVWLVRAAVAGQCVRQPQIGPFAGILPIAD